MAGIYIHIPFCRQFCHYCDFYSETSPAKKTALLDALSLELESARDFIPDGDVETVYIGGGTPSVCTPDELQRLIDRVRELWTVDGAAEITVEVNPDDLSPEYLAALAATDVNRLSIGIQSFVDRDLRLMNRRHTASAAVEAVRAAQAAGFANLTIDLMYGIPGMSADEWQRNLDQSLALNVPHISAYHLTIEPGTRFGRMAQRKELVAVDEEASREQYLTLRRTLTGAGYDHYEISNFARPGFVARHNSAYWRRKNYLGVGPSAHSYNGRERRWSVASLEKYLSGVGGGTIYESEKLGRSDLYNEFLMTSLRCAEGIDMHELVTLFGFCGLIRFEKSAQAFYKTGALVKEDGRVCIPPEFFLTSDHVIGGLFV